MIKRLFDASLSGFGLLVSIPLWCVIPLAIKLEDGGPVFFPQGRVGLDGRVFDALKFRSMRPDAESLTGPVQATIEAADRDSRLRGTAFGAPRADRFDAGLRAARHLDCEQVPARPLVHEAGGLLARPQADPALVLDNRTGGVGSSRPQGLSGLEQRQS